MGSDSKQQEIVWEIVEKVMRRGGRFFEEINGAKRDELEIMDDPLRVFTRVHQALRDHQLKLKLENSIRGGQMNSPLLAPTFDTTMSTLHQNSCTSLDTSNLQLKVMESLEQQRKKIMADRLSEKLRQQTLLHAPIGMGTGNNVSMGPYAGADVLALPQDVSIPFPLLVAAANNLSSTSASQSQRDAHSLLSAAAMQNANQEVFPSDSAEAAVGHQQLRFPSDVRPLVLDGDQAATNTMTSKQGEEP